MPFYDKYALVDEKSLVEILENPSQYVQECLHAVHNILSDRNIPEAELMDIARNVNRLKARETIERLDPINDELVPHQSYFLNKEEVRLLYVEELDEHMKNKEGFRFDVWHYAIGGIV